ncbi:predicted protein [Naegleria gruberi]|uniref:Fucosyltransferase n=1 Tax=Naegleria gruberi TaxID=5762 RepID=D2VRE9_NAEGR|nr:uncharacterized protein NAEGRDRAFT_71561 [Naegleria gruberi]EFC40658.1 predicted protein [Naegleria gruberi]|eukprot:XP_002673402.1 predicted protein [Naegleria gruberi strain NEG-M]
MLGNTKFSDPIMAKLGFQDTWTTSDSMFSYFRTFDTSKCTRQHSSKIYGDKSADIVSKERGLNLDAVLVLCEYSQPFFLSTKEEELRNIEVFQRVIELESSQSLIRSHKIDELYGENMWRGMRRLSIFMCSEAVLHENIQPLTQTVSDIESMKRFSESTADISVCYLSTCSVWVNYLYYPIELAKSAFFGKKKRSGNSGICAFVSNCKDGTYAKERYQTLTTLSKFIPIRQYGRCGRNAQEGPDGKQFELENNCKFYFAAENSISKDYVTEKFFEGVKALQNGAKLLIIYRGAQNIKDWGFPSSLFIDINDFKSTEELGAYLKELNDNDEKFEKRFAQITEEDRKKVDEVINTFQYKLGANIPCRITKIIGEMKLARYLLFKIGLKSINNKVNYLEWNEFKRRFSDFGKERIQILDSIYHMAFGIFQSEGNYKNMFSSGWKFD